MRPVIRISTPAEEGWPSQAGVVKEEEGYVIYRNGWGMLQRQLAHSFGEIRHGFFGQELQVVCQEKIDPDKLEFESPQNDSRYEWTSRFVRRNADRFAIIGKAAGAAKVLMHSDGNIEAVLDLFVAAGIDAVNPVEPKAGMNLERLRKKYDGKLAFIGGMCNARVLPQGSREEIVRHVQSILELGKEGGVVLAAHSIGSDISIEHYDWAMEAYHKYR